MSEKQYKILLIDDDEFIRMLFKDSFLIYGKGDFQVYAASNFEQAEEYLKTNKPDIIFLDLVLTDQGVQKVEGLEILKKLKENPQYKDIDVVVYSGYTDLKDEVIRLGAKKFISKGFLLPKELVSLTRSLLQ